jgi:hypothetical protein
VKPLNGPSTGTLFALETRMNARFLLLIFEKYRQKYRHLLMRLFFDTP